MDKPQDKDKYLVENILTDKIFFGKKMKKKKPLDKVQDDEIYLFESIMKTLKEKKKKKKKKPMDKPQDKDKYLVENILTDKIFFGKKMKKKKPLDKVQYDEIYLFESIMKTLKEKKKKKKKKPMDKPQDNDKYLVENILIDKTLNENKKKTLKDGDTFYEEYNANTHWRSLGMTSKGQGGFYTQRWKAKVEKKTKEPANQPISNPQDCEHVADLPGITIKKKKKTVELISSTKLSEDCMRGTQEVPQDWEHVADLPDKTIKKKKKKKNAVELISSTKLSEDCMRGTQEVPQDWEHVADLPDKTIKKKKKKKNAVELISSTKLSEDCMRETQDVPQDWEYVADLPDKTIKKKKKDKLYVDSNAVPQWSPFTQYVSQLELAPGCDSVSTFTTEECLINYLTVIILEIRSNRHFLTKVGRIKGFCPNVSRYECHLCAAVITTITAGERPATYLILIMNHILACSKSYQNPNSNSTESNVESDFALFYQTVWESSMSSIDKFSFLNMSIGNNKSLFCFCKICNLKTQQSGSNTGELLYELLSHFYSGCPKNLESQHFHHNLNQAISTANNSPEAVGNNKKDDLKWLDVKEDWFDFISVKSTQKLSVHEKEQCENDSHNRQDDTSSKQSKRSTKWRRSHKHNQFIQHNKHKENLNWRSDSFWNGRPVHDHETINQVISYDQSNLVLQWSTPFIQYFDNLLEMILINEKFFIFEARIQGFVPNLVEYQCHLCNCKIQLFDGNSKILQIIRTHVEECKIKLTVAKGKAIVQKSELDLITEFKAGIRSLLKLNMLIKDFFTGLRQTNTNNEFYCKICRSHLNLEKTLENENVKVIDHVLTRHKILGRRSSNFTHFSTLHHNIHLEQAILMYSELYDVEWTQSRLPLQKNPSDGPKNVLYAKCEVKTIKVNKIEKEPVVSILSSTKLSEDCKRETQEVQLPQVVANVADFSSGSVSQTLKGGDTFYEEYNANTHWRSLGMTYKGGFYTQRWEDEVEKKKKEPANQPINKPQDRVHVADLPGIKKNKAVELISSTKLSEDCKRETQDVPQDWEHVADLPGKTIKKKKKWKKRKKRKKELISSTKLSEERVEELTDNESDSEVPESWEDIDID